MTGESGGVGWLEVAEGWRGGGGWRAGCVRCARASGWRVGGWRGWVWRVGGWWVGVGGWRPGWGVGVGVAGGLVVVGAIFSCTVRCGTVSFLHGSVRYGKLPARFGAVR